MPSTLYHNACIFTCDPECDSIERKNQLLYYNWLIVDEKGIIERVGDGLPPSELANEKEAPGKAASEKDPEFKGSIHVDLVNVNPAKESGRTNRDLVKIDCKGKYLIPGLHDTHCHTYGVARMCKVAELCHLRNIDRFIEVLKKKLDDIGGPSKISSFLEGCQWDQEEIGRLPSRYDLDKVSIEIPIICWRRCWHILVCNSKALEVCNIKSKYEQPETGIDIDGDGKPTGILRENACKLLHKLTDVEDTWDEKVSLLGATLRSLPKRGVVGIQTNDTTACSISNAWEVYSQLLRDDKCGPKNELPVRVYWTSDGEKDTNLSTDSANTTEINDDYLHHERCKLFLDGGLGASTAALFEDYCGEVGNKGIINLTDDEIDQAFVRAKKNNLRIEAHAIGDRAFDKIFSNFERLDCDKDYLQGPNITHCQILSKDLLQRLTKFYEKNGKSNPLFTNIQPQFTKSDLPIIVPKLGQKRAKTSYIWNTLQHIAKTVICGGSDAPVEDLCPFTGLALALRNPLHKNENLGLADGLALYSKNASQNSRFRDISKSEDLKKKFTGCLLPGSLADFVILNAFPLANVNENSKTSSFGGAEQQLEDYIIDRCLKPKSAHDMDAKPNSGVEVWRTYLGGKLVYDMDDVGCEDVLEFPREPDLFRPGRSGRPLWKCPCCT